VQRRWMVRPNPETGMADRQEIVEALMDAESMCWRAGGGFSFWCPRAPTDLPGEMVTVSAVIQWQDRTDAKAQPEVRSAPPQQEDPTPDQLEQQLTDEEEFLAEAEQGEDVSSVEAGVR
jgi:hypothetical protein